MSILGDLLFAGYVAGQMTLLGLAVGMPVLTTVQERRSQRAKAPAAGTGHADTARTTPPKTMQAVTPDRRGMPPTNRKPELVETARRVA